MIRVFSTLNFLHTYVSMLYIYLDAGTSAKNSQRKRDMNVQCGG